MPRPEPVSAHELLLEQHAFLRRLARSLVADPERADDLAQDVALLALRRPPRATGSPRAWLARVLRNRAVSVARSESRRRDREAQLPERAPPPTPPELEQRWRVQRAVVEAVGRLDEPYRQVLLLRYDRDLAPTAIAAHLGIPVSTVKTRLARALARLRRDLDEHDGPGMPSWSVVLLAGLEQARPSVASAATAAGGAILGVKFAMAAALLVAIGVWGVRWMVEGPAGSPGAAATLAATAKAGSSPVDATSPAVVVEDASRSGRTALQSSGAGQDAPDRALAIHVLGFRDDSRGPARVEVFEGPAARPRIELELEPSELWTIDLAPLFETGRPLPESLRVAVDHPDHLPAEVSVLLPSGWRDGTPAPDRARAELVLQEPKAFVTGEVQLAEEPESARLAAALYALSSGVPGAQPVDRIALGGNRRFRLRADASERHVVVAFVEGWNGQRETDPAAGARLRPASRVLTLPSAGREPHEIAPLRLEVGETISGRMEGDTPERMLVSCGATQRGGRFRQAMFWTGNGFENGPATVELQPDSGFEVHGLAPIEYEIQPATVTGVRTVEGDASMRFLSGKGEAVRVLAPARDVLLSRSVLELVFEVLGDGAPVPGAALAFAMDREPEDVPSVGASSACDAGPNGRLRVQCNPRHSLTVRISAPGYEPRSYRFDAADLRDGEERRLSFERRAAPPAALRIVLDGDLARLARPEGVRFRAFECASRSEQELAAARADPWLGSHGPGWEPVEWIELSRVPWDERQSCWSTDELPEGRYLLAATPTQYEGVTDCVVGGSTLVDLRSGVETVAAWTAVVGGNLRFSVAHSSNAGPAFYGASIRDSEGEELPVYFHEPGASSHFAEADHPGTYEVVGALPVGDYVLALHLRGGTDRSVPFRIDAERTTDVRVDLSAP